MAKNIERTITKITTSNNAFLRIMANLIRRSFNYVQYLNMLGQKKNVLVLKLIRKVRENSELGLLNNEAYQLYSCAKSSNCLDGDYAECGTWQGGSAKIICEAKGDKLFYVFDSFEGLPERTENDDVLQKGMFNCDVDKVKKYLRDYPNVFLIKGFIPHTFSSIKNNSNFAFVHIDLDFYEGTRDALNYFYSRMTRRGIILLHDYNTTDGVPKAVHEFMKDKQEQVIELSNNYCMIIKS